MQGRLLKERWKKSGIKKQDLAKSIGITVSALDQQFTSEDVRTGTVEKFCRAIGVTINELYAGTDLEQHLPKSTNQVPVPSGYVSEQLFSQILAQKDQAVIDKIQAIEEKNEVLMLVKELKNQINLMSCGLSITEIAKKEVV